jgi:hypothetical protein
VAIELTRKRLRSMVQGSHGPFRVSPRVLAGLAAAALAIAFSSVLLSVQHARRDEAAAQRRLDDAQALLALPPVSTDELRTQLDGANSSLAAAQAAASGTPVDVSSDSATTLLVLHSQSAGLAVKGISRMNDFVVKFDSGAYDVRGLRITVEGTPAQIVTFLSHMRRIEPSLMAALATMSIAETGVARAEIGFSAYTKQASPTPAPRGAMPKAGR